MAEKNGLGHLIDPQKVVEMVDFLLNDDTAQFQDKHLMFVVSGRFINERFDFRIHTKFL